MSLQADVTSGGAQAPALDWKQFLAVFSPFLFLLFLTHTHTHAHTHTHVASTGLLHPIKKKLDLFKILEKKVTESSWVGFPQNHKLTRTGNEPASTCLNMFFWSSLISVKLE